jgi:hypothetical protein
MEDIMFKNLVAVALLFIASIANAATWSMLDVNNPGFSYSVAPATTIWYYDDNITPQNAVNIKAVTENQFGLVADSLSYVSQCDTAGNSGSCTGGTSPSAGTFTSTNPFNYLAVHLGQQELLFYWDSAISAFSIEDIEGGVNLRGVSNYRAYSGVAAVPVPTSAWLLVSGLAIFGVMRRRIHS